MKISITCITPAILDFFPDIISFQHVFHLGVGRSQIEWKLKAKTQISVFPWAKIGQNDHSNPYIESTTVLSDIISYVRHFCSRGPRATRKRKPAHLKFKGHMHACCIYVANASRAITTLIERLHMYSSSLITSSAG